MAANVETTPIQRQQKAGAEAIPKGGTGDLQCQLHAVAKPNPFSKEADTQCERNASERPPSALSTASTSAPQEADLQPAQEVNMDANNTDKTANPQCQQKANMQTDPFGNEAGPQREGKVSEWCTSALSAASSGAPEEADTQREQDVNVDRNDTGETANPQCQQKADMEPDPVSKQGDLQCEEKVSERCTLAHSAASSLPSEEADTQLAQEVNMEARQTGDVADTQREQQASEHPNSALPAAPADVPDQESLEVASRSASKDTLAHGCQEMLPIADAQQDSDKDHAATKWAFLDALAKPLRRLPSEAFWHMQQGTWPEACHSVVAEQHKVKDRDSSPEARTGKPATNGGPRRATQAMKAVSFFARKREERRDALHAKAAAAIPAPAQLVTTSAPSALQPVKPAGPPPARGRVRPVGAGCQICRGVGGGLVFVAAGAGPGSLARSSGSGASAATSEGRSSAGRSMAGAAGWALRKIARKRP